MKRDFNGTAIPKKKKPAHEGVLDLFDMPVQNKYPGPNSVPPTSTSAYNEEGTQKKMTGGVEVARSLLIKFPDKTAYELLNLSQTFTDVYDLRRCLSELKTRKKAWNPEERRCKIKSRNMFTWRLV